MSRGITVRNSCGHASDSAERANCQNIKSSSTNALIAVEMGDGSLIGLLHVTPKTHLRVIKLLQTNPF